MRPRLIPLLLTLAPLAAADRLISIPTARKLTDRTYRVEYQRDRHQGTEYLAAGLGPSWEAEARLLGDGDRVTADVTYNVISPVPGLSPGFAFGVQDLLDETRTGPRLFGCATIRNEFGNSNTPFDLTIGLFVGRTTTPFVGTAVPLYSGLRLLAEHDGDRGRLGLEARPAKGFRLRLIATDGHLSGAVGYTAGF